MKTSFLTIGLIISAIAVSTGAFATGENTVTSKSYVDAMDATKQDKITAKTSGNVVTYNGTDANGQAQFDERGIFDYETGGEWDENNMYQVAEGHEGDLMTADDYWNNINDISGYLDRTLGESNTVVIRDGLGRPFDSRNIYDGSTTYNASTDAQSLITAGAVQGQIDASVTNVTNQITNINNQLNGQTLESIGVPSLTCANKECTLYQVTTNAGIAHKLYSCTTATVATDCPACGTGTKAACENNICKCNLCKADGTPASSASECCSGHRGDDGICCGSPGSGVICPGR